jgi:Domain of unknown function (DUF4272)
MGTKRMSESESSESNEWKPTRRQIDRYERTKAQLLGRKVPHLSYPLYVDDEDEVVRREGPTVARRILVLSDVVRRAEGESRKKCLKFLDDLELWEEVSAKEREFLVCDRPDKVKSQELVWRLESIWVLCWAIQLIEGLDWPSGMCDVPTLVELVDTIIEQPDLVKNAKVRSRTEILDAQSLTLLIHWAITDAWINQRCVPERLDWTEEGGLPASHCAAVGVVEQRHHTLNWLTCFGGADWDDVDTPT